MKFTIFALPTHGGKPRVNFHTRNIFKKVLESLNRYASKFAAYVYMILTKRAFLMKYISNKYDKHIQLPLALIREAIQGNWLDSLYYYIRLKGLYTKPIFYNYSLRKLADKMQCSPSTIATHIAILSEKGLCWRDGANLRLKSIRSHRDDKGLIVPVATSENKAEQIMYLRYAAIKRNLHNQVRANDTKNDVIKFHKGEIYDLKQYKALCKIAKSYPSPKKLESSCQNALTLSNNSIGKLTNRSQSTGIKIQRAFNNLFLIKSTKRTVQVSITKTNRRAFYEQVFSAQHFLTNKGFIFKRLSNRIEFVWSEYSTLQLSGQGCTTLTL